MVDRKAAGQKLAMWLLSGGFLGLLLYYGGEHSVTLLQVTVAMASIPAVFVVTVELIDRYVDMGKLYGRFSGNKNNILKGLLFGGLGFIMVLWALTGTLELAGASAPAAIIVAGGTALYIFAPDTGETEWYLVFWIAATLATMFHYFHLLPPFPGMPKIPGL